MCIIAVAPRVGARIEIQQVKPSAQTETVAPREGARIEISTLFLLMVIVMSLPVWERGLKPDKTDLIDEQEDVAPRVGVRIETPLKL